MCLVADGMGGQAAGEIASKRAVEVIPRELRKHLQPNSTADAAKTIIRKAVVQANEEIIAMGALDRDLKNMGTTVVLAIWRKGSATLFVTGVGDSRGYLIRDNNIQQLTVDHSLAQALVEAKTISAEEARDHRFRNVLWKYLGSKEVGEGPEVKVVTLQHGDRFLLCTDGLTGVVADDGCSTSSSSIRTCRNSPTASDSSLSTPARATTSPASSSKPSMPASDPPVFPLAVSRGAAKPQAERPVISSPFPRIISLPVDTLPPLTDN